MGESTRKESTRRGRVPRERVQGGSTGREYQETEDREYQKRVPGESTERERVPGDSTRRQRTEREYQERVQGESARRESMGRENTGREYQERVQGESTRRESMGEREYQERVPGKSTPGWHSPGALVSSKCPDLWG